MPLGAKCHQPELPWFESHLGYRRRQGRGASRDGVEAAVAQDAPLDLEFAPVAVDLADLRIARHDRCDDAADRYVIGEFAEVHRSGWQNGLGDRRHDRRLGAHFEGDCLLPAVREAHEAEHALLRGGLRLLVACECGQDQVDPTASVDVPLVERGRDVDGGTDTAQ